MNEMDTPYAFPLRSALIIDYGFSDGLMCYPPLRILYAQYRAEVNDAVEQR
jgi:hypothetical protein